MNKYIFKIEPITIILGIILFLGGGTGGFFIGKGTVDTQQYNVDIQYYDIKTDVQSKTDVTTDIKNKTDVITSILELDGNDGTNSYFVLTNNVTNYTTVTNTNYNELYTTNSYTNIGDISSISNKTGFISNIVNKITNL